MVSVWAIPEPYRATVGRIPPAILKDLSAREVVARVVCHQRRHESALRVGDQAVSRAGLQLASKVLDAPATNVAADYRAKAAATTDSVLRSGYYEAAVHAERDHPRPSVEDYAAADRAVATYITALKAVSATRKPNRGRPGAAVSPAVRKLIDREVSKAKADLNRRAGEVSAEISRVRARMASDAAGTQPMLYKGQSGGAR